MMSFASQIPTTSPPPKNQDHNCNPNECQQLGCQPPEIQKLFKIKPGLDISNPTLQDLHCYIPTSVRIPIYCKPHDRLSTFKNVDPSVAGKLARQGFFTDENKTTHIVCFWCALELRMELVCASNLSRIDRKHKEANCLHFNLYSECTKSRKPMQDGALNKSTQQDCSRCKRKQSCQWLAINCSHMSYCCFDCFPECFMLDSPLSGKLFCTLPKCKKVVKVFHFNPVVD